MSRINRASKFFVLCATMLVSGCATLGPVYTPATSVPADKATVYVYRESGIFGGAVAYTVSANGVPISTLPAGGYFTYFASPGEVELSAKTEAKTSVTIDAHAGETYYVKGTVGIGFFVGHPHLVIVPKEVGEKEIVTCKLVPPSNSTKSGQLELRRQSHIARS